MKINDKLKFVKPGPDWSTVPDRYNNIFKLVNIEDPVRYCFVEVSTNRHWNMSEKFLNDGLLNGYFVLINEQNVKQTIKWSCGHLRLSTDTECPVCRAFNRRTID